MDKLTTRIDQTEWRPFSEFLHHTSVTIKTYIAVNLDSIHDFLSYFIPHEGAVFINIQHYYYYRVKFLEFTMLRALV